MRNQVALLDKLNQENLWMLNDDEIEGELDDEQYLDTTTSINEYDDDNEDINNDNDNDGNDIKIYNGNENNYEITENIDENIPEAEAFIVDDKEWVKQWYYSNDRTLYQSDKINPNSIPENVQTTIQHYHIMSPNISRDNSQNN